MRSALLTLGVSLLPLGTAFAQSMPLVRVAREEADIVGTLHPRGGVVMTAAAGTVFEVIYTEGNRYAPLQDNWYWVLLPRDPWGTQRAGWVSGRDVEHVEPVAKPASGASASAVEPPRAAQDASERNGSTRVVEPSLPGPGPVVVPKVEVDAPAIPEVVLNFNFGKSNLTDEAKHRLAGAVGALKSDAKSLAISLEGHADAIGSEPFNEKLGLARAETVKRYLAEQFQIPADRINLVSYGENQPAASNATREGRAQNRRVVVRGGS